ncbi:MAG: outer membrane beta-barrel protein [Gammaproteobacteria bacterium]
MKKYYVKCISLVALGLISIFLYTSAIARADRSSRHYYFSVLSGLSWAKIGKNQSIQILNDIPANTYDDNSNHTIKPCIGVAAGVKMLTKKRVNINLGVGVYTIGSFEAKGKVYQFGDPAYYNMDYTAELHSTRIMAEFKIAKAFNTRKANIALLPYLTAGLGAAFNNMHSYSEAVTTDTAVAMSPFADKTTIAFAYQLGLGIDCKFNQHWMVGIGYLFARFGTARFGLSPAQNTDNKFRTKNIHSNNILANVTYVI